MLSFHTSGRNCSLANASVKHALNSTLGRHRLKNSDRLDFSFDSPHACTCNCGGTAGLAPTVGAGGRHRQRGGGGVRSCNTSTTGVLFTLFTLYVRHQLLYKRLAEPKRRERARGRREQLWRLRCAGQCSRCFQRVLLSHAGSRSGAEGLLWGCAAAAVAAAAPQRMFDLLCAGTFYRAGCGV